MKAKIRCVAAALALAACAAVSAAESRGRYAKMMEDPDMRYAVFALFSSALREKASQEPVKALENAFTRDAMDSWKSMTVGEYAFIDEQLKDFFSGALVLDGASGADGALAAMYNPWWDAILLMKEISASADLTAGAEVQVSEVYFLSGETFRGGKVKAGEVPSVRTVVPVDEPLAISVLRATAETVAAFEKNVPQGTDTGWWGGTLGRALMRIDRAAEMERIHVRSLLRLQHLYGGAGGKGLYDLPEASGIARWIEDLARTANMVRMGRYFREPNSRGLMRQFTELPSEARRGFSIYGFVPAQESSLFVFVNTEAPRLFAIACLDKDPDPRTSSFEWYDFGHAKEYVDAWDAEQLRKAAADKTFAGKGVAK